MLHQPRGKVWVLLIIVHGRQELWLLIWAPSSPYSTATLQAQRKHDAGAQPCWLLNRGTCLSEVGHTHTSLADRVRTCAAGAGDQAGGARAGVGAAGGKISAVGEAAAAQGAQCSVMSASEVRQDV